jgi:Leucine-rich repeat (LRR) protein
MQWNPNDFNKWIDDGSPPLPDNEQPLTLDLSNSGLVVLPASVGKLTALQAVNLNDNDFTSLPDTLANLTALESLQLDHNNLSTFPDVISRLTTLTRLDMANNQLTSLPDTIGRLTLLSWFDVNDNRLTTLPEAIGNMANLEGIYADDNQLSSLPESICASRIRTLSLDNNAISALPTCIGHATSLRTVGLNNNQLTSLPETIGELTNLVHLELNGNLLTSLPESIGNLTLLQNLGVEHNQLTRLPDTIADLAELNTVSFAFNQIADTPLRNGTTEDDTWRRNEVQVVGAMQVHDAFRPVVTNFQQLIPLLAGPPNPDPSVAETLPLMFRGDTFSPAAARLFANWYGQAGQTESIERLFNHVIQGGLNLNGRLNSPPLPPVTFKELITASLQFGARHFRSPSYLASYVDMFISSSLHAYDAATSISCPKGILERIITELSNAIVVAFDELVANGPDSADDLVQIVYLISGKNRDDLLPATNRTPKRIRELVLDKGTISDWGSNCLNDIPEDADVPTQKTLFKACILAAMRNEPAPYNEAESEAVLDAYIAGADGEALFYGGRRKRKVTRKRRAKPQRKPTRKRRKMPKRKQTRKKQKAKKPTRRAKSA